MLRSSKYQQGLFSGYYLGILTILLLLCSACGEKPQSSRNKIVLLAALSAWIMVIMKMSPLLFPSLLIFTAAALMLIGIMVKHYLQRQKSSAEK